MLQQRTAIRKCTLEVQHCDTIGVLCNSKCYCVTALGDFSAGMDRLVRECWQCVWVFGSLPFDTFCSASHLDLLVSLGFTWTTCTVDLCSCVCATKFFNVVCVMWPCAFLSNYELSPIEKWACTLAHFEACFMVAFRSHVAFRFEICRWFTYPDSSCQRSLTCKLDSVTIEIRSRDFPAKLRCCHIRDSLDFILSRVCRSVSAAFQRKSRYVFLRLLHYRYRCCHLSLQLLVSTAHHLENTNQRTR